MNRENKRKTFEKGYYKTHACNDTFTCKVCGRVCTPQNAGSDHRNHCPNCLSSLHVDEEPGDRASDCGGIMEPVAMCSLSMFSLVTREQKRTKAQLNLQENTVLTKRLLKRIS